MRRNKVFHRFKPFQISLKGFIVIVVFVSIALGIYLRYPSREVELYAGGAIYRRSEISREWVFWGRVVRNGETTYFYEDGTPMLKCTYVDGLENGEESRFYANGRLSSKKCYASGLLVGAHQVFDIDGNLVASGEYRQGIRWSGTFLVPGKYLPGPFPAPFERGEMVTLPDESVDYDFGEPPHLYRPSAPPQAQPSPSTEKNETPGEDPEVR